MFLPNQHICLPNFLMGAFRKLFHMVPQIGTVFRQRAVTNYCNLEALLK